MSNQTSRGDGDAACASRDASLVGLFQEQLNCNNSAIRILIISRKQATSSHKKSERCLSRCSLSSIRSQQRLRSDLGAHYEAFNGDLLLATEISFSVHISLSLELGDIKLRIVQMQISPLSVQRCENIMSTCVCWRGRITSTLKKKSKEW